MMHRTILGAFALLLAASAAHGQARVIPGDAETGYYRNRAGGGGGSMTTLPQNNIYVGNAGNTATAVPMSGDCDIVSSGNISCLNRRLAKTANYTVAAADCGKTIALGGGSQFILTVPAPAGLPVTCQVRVLNEDCCTAATWHGKIISGVFGGDFILAPGQVRVLFIQNGLWWKDQNERWKPDQSVTFFINPAGNDATNDCLQASTPCNTVFGAIAKWKGAYDCAGGGFFFQLAQGTYVIANAAQEAYAWTGGCALTIIGSSADHSVDPTPWILQATLGSTCFSIREPQTVVIISGVTCHCPSAIGPPPAPQVCGGVDGSQGIVYDINNWRFTAAASSFSTLISCAEQSMCNVFKPQILARGTVFLGCGGQSYCGIGGTMTIGNNLDFPGGFMNVSSLSTAFTTGGFSISGGAGQTGPRYIIAQFAHINIVCTDPTPCGASFNQSITDSMPGTAGQIFTGATAF